ncbi:MAG: chromosomal replication initiator protein DnaA [Clostridia bacterium]|nr:chromosomal replication initiator protein DnaA [Clostridia bacterium]
MAYLDEFRGVWKEILDGFSETLSASSIDLWFGNLKFVSFKGETLTISVDSLFKYNRIRTAYLQTIQDEFSRLLGFDIIVDLIFDDSEKGKSDTASFAESESSDENKNEIKSSESTEINETEIAADKRIQSRHYEYTFDNFIVGNSNRFAHAACTAVAANPAMNYNPLFIYGPSGLGKTHLLYAITNEVSKKNPNANFVYVNSEEFTNEFINALAKNKTAEFRDKYRSCDMLLIDDIQFIAGKISTQEEFFHTFNALYEDHKQIILTSDRPPIEMKTLEERLKTRFEWGLVADIQPPDLELRIAIVKNKAEQMNVKLSDEILTYIAENLRSNIRQIEGAVKKLAAISFLSGNEIDFNTARDELKKYTSKEISVEDLIDKIFASVYQKYNVKREDLIGPKRSKNIAEPRHITIYLVRKITDISLPSIGKIFNRDHSTILSSIEKIEHKLVNDPSLKTDIDEMQKDIMNDSGKK